MFNILGLSNHKLTSRPTCSRSSADLLCSSALWGGRGKCIKGRWLEKHLQAQPSWQNKGKLSVSPFQTRSFRTRGGVRKGSRKNHHQELIWCAEDRRRYTEVHQQKFYKALSIKGFSPARMVLKTKDLKYSSPISPTGMKTPGILLPQPLWVAKKYCPSVWKLNNGRHWAATKGARTPSFPMQGPQAGLALDLKMPSHKLAVFKLSAIMHTGLVGGPLIFSHGERSPTPS